MRGVVVAEGARHGTDAIVNHIEAHHDSIGFELRVTRLGHVVRGGSPTARDRVLATRLAAAAVDQLASGNSGVMTGLCGEDIVTTPLSEVTGKTKPADMKLLELARILAQ